MVKNMILNILITLQIYFKAFEALSASSKINEMFVTLKSHSKFTLSSCERRDKKISYKTVGTEFCSMKSAS